MTAWLKNSKTSYAFLRIFSPESFNATIDFSTNAIYGSAAVSSSAKFILSQDDLKSFAEHLVIYTSLFQNCRGGDIPNKIRPLSYIATHILNHVT